MCQKQISRNISLHTLAIGAFYPQDEYLEGLVTIVLYVYIQVGSNIKTFVNNM